MSTLKPKIQQPKCCVMSKLHAEPSRSLSSSVKVLPLRHLFVYNAYSKRTGKFKGMDCTWNLKNLSVPRIPKPITNLFT